MAKHHYHGGSGWRLAGRLLALLWCGFWVWFFIGNVLWEGWPDVEYAPTFIAIGVGVLLAVVLPWVWPRVGGWYHLLAAAGVGTGYLLETIGQEFLSEVLPTSLLLFIPLAVTGVLLLLGTRWRYRVLPPAIGKATPIDPADLLE